jgi:hypothetical protein
MMVSGPENFDIRQLETRAWCGQMSRPWRCSRHQKKFTFGEHARKPTLPNACSNSGTRGRFCETLGSSILVEYSVGPIITLHGQITAREYVGMLGNQVYPMIEMLFPNNDAVSKMIVTPFTRLELFCHGLTSMTVNFIFLGQHNHQVWTSLYHSDQFWRLEWGTDSHLQHL